MFETTDKFAKWDGKYKGEYVQSGNYIFRANISFEGEGDFEQFGHINVIR